jgi:hypothetical protein
VGLPRQRLGVRALCAALEKRFQVSSLKKTFIAD